MVTIDTRIFNRFLLAYGTPSMTIKKVTVKQEPLVSMNDLYPVYFLYGQRTTYHLKIYRTLYYNL